MIRSYVHRSNTNPFPQTLSSLYSHNFHFPYRNVHPLSPFNVSSRKRNLPYARSRSTEAHCHGFHQLGGYIGSSLSTPRTWGPTPRLRRVHSLIARGRVLEPRDAPPTLSVSRLSLSLYLPLSLPLLSVAPFNEYIMQRGCSSRQGCFPGKTRQGWSKVAATTVDSKTFLARRATLAPVKS